MNSTSPPKHRYFSKLPDVVIPENISITDFIFNVKSLENYGEKTCVIDAVTSYSLSYNQLYSKILKLGASLQTLFSQMNMELEKLDEKERLFCLFLPNSMETFSIFHSILKVRGVVTTINNSYTKNEIFYQLKDSQPTIIFTTGELLPTVISALSPQNENQLGNEFQKLRKIILVDQEQLSPIQSSINSKNQIQKPELIITLKSLYSLSENLNCRQVQVFGSDLAGILYSSGTTGKSKGVCLTHKNIISNLVQISACEGSGSLSKDVIISFLPYYHIYALAYHLCYTLLHGATVVVMTKFSLNLYLQSIQKFRATLLHIVPPVGVLLAKSPSVESYDLSSVRTIFSGAAPLGQETEKQIQVRFPTSVIRQGFGMTELSPTTHINPAAYIKHGSIGITLPNIECKIIDVESGEELGYNRVGELCIKGPNVMKEYLNNIEATRNTIDKEGFLHTGDMVTCDEDGYFYVVDRLKELIKYKGFQVPPAELESLLLTHPNVNDVCVVGKPDEMAGELPTAFIVLKEHSKQTTEREIIKWVEERVAPHKRLRGGVHFVHEIPKSASGKLLRRMLRSKL